MSRRRIANINIVRLVVSFSQREKMILPMA